MVTYTLMKRGLMFNQEYAAELKNPWLGQYLNFAPDLIEALRQSFWATFFDFNSGATYNPNLWTIGYELIASYLLFAILAFLPLWRHSFWLLLPLAFMIGPWKGLMGFVLGSFITRIYHHRIPKVVLISLTILGFWLSDLAGHFRGPALSVAAALLMIVLLQMPKLREHLERPFFKRLGELSYSLYVLHFAMLASFTSFMGLKFQVHNSPAKIALLYLSTALLVWTISEVGERLVDRPGVILSRRFSEKVMNLISKPI
jgi:peptidoglycan/LPS O-acetylase OafA/YrhL